MVSSIIILPNQTLSPIYCIMFNILLYCVFCTDNCFQADETKVGVLLPEMDRLFCKLLVKFVLT